jgi:hypothetical protein
LESDDFEEFFIYYNLLFRNVEIKIIFRDVPGNGSAPIKDVSDLEPKSKPRTSASARRAMEWGIEED